MPLNISTKAIGFWLGLFLFVLLLMLPIPDGLSPEAWKTAAVATLMATWWITEAIPIPATALLPVVLFPIMGVLPIDDTVTPYAHPLIFLFLGGFIIAIAMEKWNLHRRIALNIVRAVGTKPQSIIFGFMLASAFLSMWVSNTATALMMLPIVLSVVKLVDQKADASSDHHHFELVLLLGVAYGCNIGGMGTLIGTPPNALLAGFMSDTYGMEISFARWLVLGIPLVVVTLPLMYLVLTKAVYPVKMKELPGGSNLIQSEIRELGQISSAEKKVAVVFVLTAMAWISRPILSDWIYGLSDAGIAMTGAVALFLIPAQDANNKKILSWKDAEALPWGVLILFGGGLSIASAINETGLATWIGGGVSALQAWPLLILILLTVAIIIFLTEMTSNTATAAAFLPIMGSVAIGVGQDPLLFALPAALAASCAFMLPVATPPNAIVYGSERIQIPEMAKAGIWLNILFMFLISLAAYFVAPLVFSSL